ncbi:Sir2 family NAD+-dependent deacetylase [Agaribacter marinus]|uniref:NAD-dependent protein deacylase n=1 Tax=Agaribacter marinus TaxID=1431249 RepID=A0AA37SWS0_9ALTE|nr:Sir2 family NAD+-dependent deacetylase [Agaribacter marinus]GLR71128.1 NAD-dependent protein deacylase [Agaribacter marinus]
MDTTNPNHVKKFRYLEVVKAIPKPKIVILTGAGISAESGLKTFRDNNGLWENHSIEEVATPEGFAKNPDLVYRFYNERRTQLLSKDVKPNAAHIALGKLEAQLGNHCIVVTQNVDNLHERGGSINVLHMHGELTSAKCITTGKAVNTSETIDANTLCSCCQPANAMRPDIVWFGEMPYHMDAIESHIYNCDLFVSIGTSGNVYPAAGFVSFANQCGAHTLELNLEPSNVNTEFAESYYGKASEIVCEFVSQVQSCIST